MPGGCVIPDTALWPFCICTCRASALCLDCQSIRKNCFPKSIPISFSAQCIRPSSMLKSSAKPTEISVCRLRMAIQSLRMAIQSLRMAIQSLRMCIQRLQTEISPSLVNSFIRELEGVPKAARKAASGFCLPFQEALRVARST